MQTSKYVIRKPENLSNNSGIPITIADINFWICNYQGRFHVLYNECSHMGGALKATSSNLVCTVHGWTYNFDGLNLNNLGPSLKKLEILKESETHLEVLLPVKKVIQTSTTPLRHSLQIQVHSHATLELSYRDKSVLFDPWLNGSAYYGSWRLQPEPFVSAENMEVSAIVITHPHPDHFNLPTLEKINKKTPIYFPKFPSGIIERGLDQLGFINQKPMLWDENFHVGDFINISFLRPRSMWEDSAALTLIKDEGICFSWLNLVDVGSVIDQSFSENLDLLTSAFNPVASGYPLIWSHISEQRKVKILEERKKANLDMLVKRSNLMKAKYFMPFAGHWRHALPEHQKYAEMIPHTTFPELENKFKEESILTEFLGIYPGEKFNFFSGERNSINSESNLNRGNTSITADRSVLSKETLGLFIKQMEALQDKSEAFGVEKVKFTVKSTDGFINKSFSFISSNSLQSPIINIEVSIPSYILRLFAVGDANWDHIMIGYWGEWDRNPDVYPTNFMRLLQSGTNNLVYSQSEISEERISFILKRSIGDLIENNPEQTPYYLTRLGLPCINCTRSNSENLEQALILHGIDLDSNLWILRELASIFQFSQ